MDLTDAERTRLMSIRQRLARIRALLNERELPRVMDPVDDWHRYLAALKGITGNADNDLSFVATLMAKA